MHLRENEKKLFVKLVDSLCGRHSRWEVWKDMVVMFATSISNAVDTRHKEAREALFHDCAKHYNEQEMDTFAELFGQLVNAMEQGGHRDFLGDLFMSLGLGNDAGGQFFTPYNICKMMAKIGAPNMAEKVAQHGWVSLNDPACGAGATLIAAADIMYNEQHVNYQTSALFTAQDIDFTTALMCYIQLSLYGCPGYVHVGNTLTEPMTGPLLFGDGGENTWYTPMYFSGIWEGRRKVAIMDGIIRGWERPNRREAAKKPPEDMPPAPPEPAIIRVTEKKPRKPAKKAKPEQMTLWEVLT